MRGASSPSGSVYVVLLGVGLSMSGGCQRDFAFLGYRVPQDAGASDATNARDVGLPDTSVTDATDAPSHEDALSKEDASDSPVPIDAGDGPSPEDADAGKSRVVVTHQISMQGKHMCMIDPITNDVLCRGEPESDASPDEWHTVMTSADGGAKLEGARTLAVGRSFACAIAFNEVVCWGTDPGTMQYSAVAHTVLSGLNQFFDNLQAGEGHVCVSSPVWCWGDNTYSQITDLMKLGSTEIDVPVILPEFANTTLLTLGAWHTCANYGDRTRCWGLDDTQQCGGPPDYDCSGSFPCRTKPHEVPGISGALGLGLGSSHSCAIKADGTVACWGFSHRGQAGVLPPVDCSTESCVVGVTDVPNLSGVTRLALGASHSCAATADGFAYCWGDNQAGQLGFNNQGSGGPTPVIVRTLFAGGVPISNVVDIAASDDVTCVLKRDSGVPFCWGTWKKTETVPSAATEIRPH